MYKIKLQYVANIQSENKICILSTKHRKEFKYVANSQCMELD
jgi:hypothetical protein